MVGGGESELGSLGGYKGMGEGGLDSMVAGGERNSY